MYAKSRSSARKRDDYRARCEISVPVPRKFVVLDAKITRGASIETRRSAMTEARYPEFLALVLRDERLDDEPLLNAIKNSRLKRTLVLVLLPYA